jgi:Right handed beta helix region
VLSPPLAPPTLPGVLLAAALLAAGPLAAQEGTGGAVAGAAESRVLRRATVDCSAGQSVGAALRLPGDDLEIEVTGLCRESVTIQRDGVSLLGGDALRDGLRPPDGVATEAVLVVRGARRVRIENLSLSGSTGDGLHVVAAPDSIELTGCRLEGNEGWGATVTDSEVRLERTAITGNGSGEGRSGGGLLITRGSSVTCVECVIGDNPTTAASPGVVLLSGSRLIGRDSSIEGSSALVAQLHSSASLTDTDLLGSDWTIEASYESEIFVRGGELFGSVLAADRSALQLFGITQTFNPAQNFVTESSSLLLDDRAADAGGPVPSHLEGLTLVSDFSTGKVIDGSELGELTCRLDSRVFCDGSETKIASSGCGRCP